MKNKLLLAAICGLLFSAGLSAQKLDPVIELIPMDYLDCENYDFEVYQWLPYHVDAAIQNADEITWTTSGDGTFDDAGIEQPEYTFGREDRLNQAVTLEVTATGNNTTVSADITLHIPLQLVPITKEGFSGISLYVDKSETPVPVVLDPVVEHLEIIINQQGTSYWPAIGVNNLGNWSSIGYQAKFINPPACLPVYGDPVEDQTFLLEGSFTYLPIFTDQLVNIEELLGDNADKILEIRDWKDSLTWTPDDPQFEYFKPGLAYLVIIRMGNLPFTVEFAPYSWELPMNTDELENREIEVFPNPAHGIFNIKTDDANTPFRTRIFNAQGSLILDQPGSGHFTINLTGQPQGFYFIKITQGDRQFTRKLILQ